MVLPEIIQQKNKQEETSNIADLILKNQMMEVAIIKQNQVIENLTVQNQSMLRKASH